MCLTRWNGSWREVACHGASNSSNIAAACEVGHAAFIGSVGCSGQRGAESKSEQSEKCEGGNERPCFGQRDRGPLAHPLTRQTTWIRAE